MNRKTIAPRAPTPASGVTGGGRSTRWLPTEVLEQTCRRVGIAALAFAGLWAVALVMQNFVSRIFLPMPGQHGVWPMPGNLLAGIGLGMSLAMVVVAGRLHDRPELLLDVGLGFEVATALLIGLLNQWIGVPEYARGGGVSWICVIVLVYPAIAPAAPGKTLVAALLAASMDPFGYLIGLGRGVEYGTNGFELAWAFVPNYVCAILAVIPVHVIRGLGQRYSRAKELGSYRLGDVLGEGGMGAVYRATHRMLARPAAIKLIRSDVLGAGTPVDARVAVERFRREARAAASLRSPHTIELYDFGATEDGSFYYVMELLEGLNLQQLVDRFGPVPAERSVHLLQQACLSLGEAHERGLIHRDIKPSNLVSCRMGLEVDFLKVLDFGLVKADPKRGREQTLLTSPNVTTGTPAFMSPEAALGDRPVDRRADIYALGCVAYWLLTGRVPFEGANSVAVLMQHVKEDPVPPSRRAELPIPEGLERIVLTCLAKDPDDRPRDAWELYRRLDEVRFERPWCRKQAEEWWKLHLPEFFELEDAATWTREDEPESAPDAPLIAGTG